MNSLRAAENNITGPKKPAPQLASLSNLEGTWNITGINYLMEPEGGQTEVTGTLSNKWLSGNFFLTTDWTYRFGNDQHIGSGTMGFNETLNCLFLRNFDNMGYERLYEIDIYKNTWNYRGEHERATLVFNDAGNKYEEYWEFRTGEVWKPLCRRTGHKQ